MASDREKTEVQPPTSSSASGGGPVLWILDAPALQARIPRVLALASLTGRPGSWEMSAGGSGVRLVLVERSRLPPRAELAARLALQDAPTLVVLAPAGDPLDRADLRAMGVAQILDPDGSDEELATSIAALAGTEAVVSPGAEPHGHAEEPLLADFASRSPRMLAFLELVHRVADSEAALLITGETGVGKERLARGIHTESSRGAAPFVSVNVGALPENLLEDELFGHEAGAFTGADSSRKGRFEQAAGGTVFLDEIGELSPHLQVNLLTVLQRRAVQRLGGEEPMPVDVRVMAATNRDLEEEVAAGRFREDLYYRLNVVPLQVPPLREHAEDIPGLAGRFLGWFRETAGRADVRGFTGPAMDALMEHAWPGNVRELINVVERGVLLCRGTRIGLDDLPRALRGSGRRAVPAHAGSERQEAERPPGRGDPGGTGSSVEDLPAACRGLPLREARQHMLDRFEKAYLVDLLRTTSGQVGETARRAGIAPRSLYDKMKRHGLRKEDFR